MSTVNSLGYVVVRGPLEPWKQFGTEVLGLQLGRSSDPDTLLFRNDERAWRLAVEAGEPAGPDSLEALGLEVRSREDLQRLADELRAKGVEVREDPELARRRQVQQLVSFRDAAGYCIEAYWGATVDAAAFVSPRGVSFVAGETPYGDMGIGHTFLFTGNAEKSAAFWIDNLGFRLSDTIALGPEPAIFLHCNPRHHSAAFASIPGAPPSGLGHLMLEVSTLEAVGRAADIAAEHDVRVSMTLGEHTNDRMTSVYLTTPSGFDIEYGWNGRVIDDEEWTVSHYGAISLWGHRFLTPPSAPVTS
ncbi:VOC family protein [Streptomyces vastus]|uniref:VOC family protein n=1 Tax=Streptomyces vastus TaxID=285451 RepID=A0ABN3R869_9ACTN